MRRKSALRATVFAFVVAAAITCRAATPCYIGLYADPMHCDLATFTESPFGVVDMWVWIQPSDVGLQAVEFSITPIANTWQIGEYWNPATEFLTIGDNWSGVSIAFPECQTDWVWTHRLVMLVAYPTTVGFWQIAGRWDAEPYFKQYASCEPDHPIYPLTVLNPLALNQCPYMCGCYPRLRAAEAVGSSALRVTFGSCVDTRNEPYADRFHLFLEGSDVEAMNVVFAERISDTVFDLSLDAPLSDGATYVLVAKDVISCDDACPWIESSSKKFVCAIPVATLLRDYGVSLVEGTVEVSWSLFEIDPGATFLVSRSADGGAFEALIGAPSEESPLRFRYVDANVEPGREYVYQVVYSADGEPLTLFTSNAVAIPAARLALHQNVPNPFNPSTTISFTLPEACAATLEIYDVAGRLVARDPRRRASRRGLASCRVERSRGQGERGGAGDLFLQARRGKRERFPKNDIAPVGRFCLDCRRRPAREKCVHERNRPGSRSESSHQFSADAARRASAARPLARRPENIHQARRPHGPRARRQQNEKARVSSRRGARAGLRRRRHRRRHAVEPLPSDRCRGGRGRARVPSRSRRRRASRPTGTLLLDRLFGATVHWCGGETKGERIPAIAEELRAKGRAPYVIPFGGSNAVGALGFVAAIFEVAEQLRTMRKASAIS